MWFSCFQQLTDMPLSISSSDTAISASRARLDRFTVLLLLTVLAVLGIAECVSAIAFDRASKVQRRELSQRRILSTVRDTGSATAHIAVVGNSLMLEGLRMPLLQEKIEPEVVPVPYFVLATGYYDWLFGLKRLFAEGFRPRYLLLGLSPLQLASSSTRGDYSARYLFQARDLIEIARRTHMDATSSAGFILSHYSEFYGTRDVIRRFLILKLLPSVAQLFQRLGSSQEGQIDEARLSVEAAERLQEMDQLCRENGSRFMLVVPPSYQRGAEAIMRVGANSHIVVLVPVHSGFFDNSYYQPDGFHLNEKGARIFTARLAADLLKELPN